MHGFAQKRHLSIKTGTGTTDGQMHFQLRALGDAE
jgi:hypothetical protein